MNPPDQSPLHSPLPWYFDQSGVLRDARHYAVKLPEEGSPMNTGEEQANAELVYAAVNTRREFRDLLTRLHARITDADWCDDYAGELAEIEAALKLEEKP